MASPSYRGPGPGQTDGHPAAAGADAAAARLRMLKRWRWVGVYGPDESLCVGSVRMGPARQSFWAVWERDAGRLHERTVRSAGGIELEPGRVRVQAEGHRHRPDAHGGRGGRDGRARRQGLRLDAQAGGRPRPRNA